MKIDRTLSIAPMMGCTDRHDRYLLRLMSKHVLLYSEMVTTAALIHSDANGLLQYNDCEHPVALQLGGSDPAQLALCAKMAQDYGYDEVNLNVGCPSARVQKGKIGACLMAEPQLVAEGVAAMKQQVNLPVTVKTRIGIDDLDSYQHLVHFIDTVASAGCEVFIIHARKAWLNGLNPRQNRHIPPLHYDVVQRLKQDFPYLNITVNGGIKTHQQIQEHLSWADGVMIGREAYDNPYMLAEFDRLYYGDTSSPFSRREVVDAYLAYAETQVELGCKVSKLAKHLFGMYQGVPGARRWRRYMSEHMYRPGAGLEVIRAMLPQES